MVPAAHADPLTMDRAFRDRTDAGRQLAAKLTEYSDRRDLLVLGLPRGGIPVAFEVARALHAPLDVYVVRKLGVPGHEELAMGAIAGGGILIINDAVVQTLGIPPEIVARIAESEHRELERRESAYRGNRLPAEITGRTLILVDDGIATGSSMRAAIAALRKQLPAKVIVAIPTIAAATFDELLPVVDELIAVIRPEIFSAVGEWYANFGQTSDEEVRDLLERREM